MMIQTPAVAVELVQPADRENFPSAESWELAPPIRFDSDWQGKNSDPQVQTEVRLLWTHETLYLQFRAKYRTISVFPDAEPNGRRDKLWDRDVAEIFVQPDGFDPQHYLEFEVSPNGFWIDLDIFPGKTTHIESGLRRRVVIDEKNRTWTAELALPMKNLTANFDPVKTWRVNFFRVEGPAEPRFYSSWQPTKTEKPNFHVPAVFAPLIFKTVDSKSK